MSKILIHTLHFAETNDVNISLPTLPSTLSFQPNDSIHTFSVNSLQDEVIEGDECMYFLLESVNEDFVMVPDNSSTITVCIQDDDCELHIIIQVHVHTIQRQVKKTSTILR